jgi:hypothetical protein
MLPEPAVVDVEAMTLAQTAKGLERGLSIGLKARWNALGILTGRALEAMTVYHATDRHILTPQIKAACKALYGHPLPRSPLLPR